MFSSFPNTSTMCTKVISPQNGEVTMADQLNNILFELSDLYEKSVRSIEGTSGFNSNCMRPLGRNHLLQKPSCMFIGPYSSGKSTAIAYLLQSKDPAIKIGPEPTTDTFHFLLYGPKVASGEGTYLMNDPSFGLDNFFENDGSAEHCRWTTMPNSVLNSLIIIDSPGFLSGENMIQQRGFDISLTVEKFAARVTQIYLIVDINKVDISAEFKSVIKRLSSHFGKVKIIINKADGIETFQLMRVMSAFFFNFGKIYPSPEVPRAFVGSFWDQPYVHDSLRTEMDSEKNDLLNDLQKLPAKHYPNVVGCMITRMNLFLHYLVTVREFRKMMPFFKKETKKAEILNDFDAFYEKCLDNAGISYRNQAFPSTIKTSLGKINPANVPELCTSKNIEILRKFITVQMPNIIMRLNETINMQDDNKIHGGVFTILETSNRLMEVEEIQRMKISEGDVAKADKIFATFSTTNGRADMKDLKSQMMESKLPYESLAKIWDLSTDTSDGLMDVYEWRIAYFLLKLFGEGKSLPSTLPPHLCPSSMRPT